MVRSVALPVSQEGPPQPLIEPSRFASQWPRFKTPEGTNLETPIQVGRTHCLATIGSSDPPKLPNSQALASMLANANANANCMMTKPEALRWPDGIQHAVFYTDDVCHNVQVGRPEFTWHVERLGTQAVQCESPPAGLFKSVEFMEAEEYEEFSKRMRGQDAPGSEARWRSII
ncbi:MAG: hypothetical protein Q9194_007215 [Teloschistes cf. exilis]